MRKRKRKEVREEKRAERETRMLQGTCTTSWKVTVQISCILLAK